MTRSSTRSVAPPVLYALLIWLSFSLYGVAAESSNLTLAGSAVVAHFPQIPNFLLTFKDVNGNLIPNTTMTAAWVSLDEVDNSTGGAVSVTLTIGGDPVIVDRIVLADPALVWAQTNYTPPDGSYQNINFSTTAANGVGISFIYYFFPAAHTLYYPYINFSHTLPPNSFKFSISVDNWRPKNMSNLFLIRTQYLAYPYWTYFNYTTVGYVSSGDFWIDYKIILKFNLLTVALANGVTLGHLSTYGAPLNISFVGANATIAGFDEFYYFPIFNGSWFYDPDLSVLVGDGSVSTNGDGGSSSDLLKIVLPAVLVPIVFLIAVVVVVIIVIVAAIRVTRKLKATHRLTHGSVELPSPISED